MPITFARALSALDYEAANARLLKATKFLSAMLRKLTSAEQSEIRAILLSSNDYNDLVAGVTESAYIDDEDVRAWMVESYDIITLYPPFGIVIKVGREVPNGHITYVTGKLKPERPNWFASEVLACNWTVMDTESLNGGSHYNVSMFYSERWPVTTNLELPPGYELVYSGPVTDAGTAKWRITVKIPDGELTRLSETYAASIAPPWSTPS